MDEIQSVLIKMGRKDLAQEYYLKTAAFPAIFLKLKPDERDSISRNYGIGPKSEVTEIAPEKAATKPYSEGLVVYTTSVLSEKEQRKARDEVYELERTIEKELANDPAYTKIKGSIAGNEYRQEKVDKAKIEIDKKYVPQERPVAWGIGIDFRVNNEMFSYSYGHRRGRSRSDAPGNRKELIGYIKQNGGKAYFISVDPEVGETRKQRQQQRPADQWSKDFKTFKERAKAYADKKMPLIESRMQEVFKAVKAEVEDYKNKLDAQVDATLEKVKSGSGYSASIGVVIPSAKALSEIGSLMYSIKNSLPSSATDFKWFLEKFKSAGV